MPVSFAPSLAFAFTENLRNGTSCQLILTGEFFVGKENSFVVQPKEETEDADLLERICHLLFNPTNELGNQPFPHSQRAQGSIAE